MWPTSICWTVRSRKVFSLRTLMRLLGPLQPMLVPRPPFSFTTTSLFRLSAMLSGIPFTLILSYGWIWDKDKKEKQLSVRAYFHFFQHLEDYIIRTGVTSSDHTEVVKFHPDAVAIGVCMFDSMIFLQKILMGQRSNVEVSELLWSCLRSVFKNH